ncbi:hypothetical protein LL240_04710 [Oceanimonas baumannii]|uniref:glutamate ligase domain-containing protein n=1 Tax=Oceanimonas baumannii TaxID=129578 RepID=UPI001D1891E4|nr:cyanophycin synthetase [Oceanimonas baumannii]MCC4263755.1 hypothetical protein [Oceanimonas baumannii]
MNSVLWVSFCFCLATDQIAQTGLSSLPPVIYYSEQLFKILKISNESGRVFVDFFGSNFSYNFPCAASHFVLNSVGVAASLYALNEDWKRCIRYLERWQPLDGRGNLLELTLPDSINVSVINDSFNAAPIAMKEALINFSNRQVSKGRKIAVLGEMLETGEYDKVLHKELAEIIVKEASLIDLIYVKGSLYNEFWSLLPEEKKGGKFNDAESLEEALLDMLKDNDEVIFKGSHGSSIYKIPQSMMNKYLK